MTEQQAAVLEGAIAAWENLTGHQLMGNKQNMLTFRAVGEIREAFKLDDTGVTALLILNAETEEYASQVSYSVKDMIDAEEAVLKKVQAFSAIRRTLKDPAFASILTNFNTILTQAIEHYGCMTPEVKKLLADPNEIAYIRRDALRALHILREDVFAKGPVSGTPMKFNPGVFLFWNINSMLRILGNAESGLTLCLVQNSEEANGSHFAFFLKNGGNLITWSDKPKFYNPEQVRLQSFRGGSHELAGRMKQLRFPYDLMGGWVDAKGRGNVDIPGSNTLVPAQKEAIQVASMMELPADTLIWLAMVFDLISSQCWKQPERLEDKPLSYTGAMIEQPLTLTEGCQALQVRDYKPLQFQPLKTEDIVSDKVDFQIKKTGQNRWMEERYKDQVPAEMLNPLPSTNPQLPEHLMPQVTDRMMMLETRNVEAERARLAPMKLREDSWGTPAELKRDHVWIARRNFAKNLERLAIAEFEKEKANVMAWYRARLEANKDFWLRGLVSGSLVIPCFKSRKSFFDIETRGERVDRNVLDYWPRERKDRWMACSSREGIHLHNGYERAQDGFYCYLSPENIGHDMAIIAPDCPEGIAALCGCKLAEIPVFLQNWFAEKAYSGNHILSDVDPLEVIDNPWIEKFSAKVCVRFGRKGFYALQRRFGLPKNLPWAPKETAQTPAPAAA